MGSDSLNYHHLLYFWTVAREGSVTRASELLGLTQPTVSTQVAALEKYFEQPLFRRTGRAVVRTEAGQLVYEYADEIFKLGQELDRVMKARPSRGRSAKVVVGVCDAIPKLIVYRLLEPILNGEDQLDLRVVEDKPDRLMVDLSMHSIDLVISDTKLTGEGKVHPHHHLLGECGVSIMASTELAAKIKKGFPQSLNGAPLLMPAVNSALRKLLDDYFDDNNIRPINRGEFTDSALLKVFGGAGVGAFAVPTAIENDVKQQYSVVVVGRLEDVKERYYAVTVERRLRHPAILKIAETARYELFNSSPKPVSVPGQPANVPHTANGSS